MEVKVNVPDNPAEGIVATLAEDYRIQIVFEDGEVGIWADKEGLLSLARQLLFLAQEAVPSGRHIHFGPDSGLDENSLACLIGKLDS